MLSEMLLWWLCVESWAYRHPEKELCLCPWLNQAVYGTVSTTLSFYICQLW